MCGYNVDIVAFIHYSDTLYYVQLHMVFYVNALSVKIPITN